YPGETDAHHANTVAFAQAVGFQRTHVFRYSPRPRTFAATLPDDVPDDVKRSRHAELQAVVDASNREFSLARVGRTLDVLVEGGEGGPGMLSGHTPDYVKVRFAGERRWIGRIVPVNIESVESDAAVGAIPAAWTAPVEPAPAVGYLPLATVR
ncbi:MAG: TRAM domain-containing protein, partial [Armatimonadota bacterium]